LAVARALALIQRIGGTMARAFHDAVKKKAADIRLLTIAIAGSQKA
jgi:hypothetical protein